MQITIAAIGKINPRSPEQALFAEYSKRLPWKLMLKELELRKSSGPRKADETALLLEATAPAERRIALDERGKSLSSREFADTIRQWQNQGVSSLGFIIGGADGLEAELLKPCHLLLSFGRMSWPHMLARAMLAEQLYRAHTLLSGHPYHRD